MQTDRSPNFVSDWTIFYPMMGCSASPGWLSGERVGLMIWWSGGCEFDLRLRQTFFPAYFRLSSLQKHVRKVVGGFGKKSCTGVRKPGNTCASPTAMC